MAKMRWKQLLSHIKKLDLAQPEVSVGKLNTKSSICSSSSSNSSISNSNNGSILCLKKTSPSFLTVTWKPIIRFW